MSDLRRLAGSVVVTGVPGGTADAATVATLQDLGPGGFVLFDRNVTTLDGTRALVRELRAAIGGDDPALAGVDQEGGRVVRLRFRDVAMPAMLALGATNDETLAERAGRALADDVLRIGANVDFAPVLDLALDAGSTLLGTRSLGDDPARTSRLGVALVRGLQSRGVAATLKHFPGHGATALDSHREMPVVREDLASLRARDLVPFAAAIAAGARAVMTAHVLVPALDADRPATLSPRILGRLLREELGFEGVCFTDCLQMEAIAGGVGSVRGGVEALAAGADGLLVSHDLALACALRDAIVVAVRYGDVPRARLDEAVARMSALRSSLARGATDTTDDVPLAIARAAIALVRGNPQLDSARAVTVVSFEGDASDGVARVRAERPSLSLALRRRRFRSESMRVALAPDQDALEVLLDVLRAQGERAIVVLARRAHLHERQSAAIDAILAFAPHAIVVSALEPFDVPAFEAAATLLCSFGDDEANLEALADVLAGDIRARGTFPVRVSTGGARRMLTEAEIDAKVPVPVRTLATGGGPTDDAEAGGA